MYFRVLSWISERIIELILGTLLIYTVYPRSNIPSHPGVIGELSIDLGMVSLFYVISGYVISCLLFSIFLRRRNNIKQAAIAGIAFIVHASVFLLVLHQADMILPIVAPGVIIVVIASFVGSLILRRSGPDRVSEA